MTERTTKPDIAIVGGGLGGTLFACYEASKGRQVNIFEQRGDPRLAAGESGRSINMTLAKRGMVALKEAGLLEQILPLTMPLKGRMIHATGAPPTFQPYGTDESEVLYAIRRRDLNAALLQAAERFPNVQIMFNKRCVRLDKERGRITLEDERSHQRFEVEADLIVGADGAFSVVRQQMHRSERVDFQQEFMSWGFKELTIPAGANAQYLLEREALHVWPREHALLLALPNLDGSFTCTLVLPFNGNPSFASLNNMDRVRAFLVEQFGDITSLIPSLANEFLRNPAAAFVTNRTSQWHYKDRVVLIGDAVHAVFPFYGQGMNAAFEDCSVLSLCLERHSDREAALAEYQLLRKRNTDALADLSKQNFVELQQQIQSPLFVARKKVDLALSELFPDRWTPLYTLIAHRTIPYADAVEQVARRNRIATWLGLNLVVTLLAIVILVHDFVNSTVEATRRGAQKIMARPSL